MINMYKCKKKNVLIQEVCIDTTVKALKNESFLTAHGGSIMTVYSGNGDMMVSHAKEPPD